MEWTNGVVSLGKHRYNWNLKFISQHYHLNDILFNNMGDFCTINKKKIKFDTPYVFK